jgi:hypothetical protein
MFRIETFADDFKKLYEKWFRSWFHAGGLETLLCVMERQWVLFKSLLSQPLM